MATHGGGEPGNNPASAGQDAGQPPQPDGWAEEAAPEAGSLQIQASDEEFTDVVDSESESENDEEQEEEEGGGAAAAAAAQDWPGRMASAAALLSAGKFGKAINAYSELLQCSSIEGGTGACPTARQRHRALLLARSASYSGFSHNLRHIPAAESESRAIFAPDPCQLAALGLKDAEAAIALQPDCPEALLHKGWALFLLERYQEAEAAYLAGLQQQPTHDKLQERLQEVREALADSGSGAGGSGSGSKDQAAAGGPAERAARQLQHTDDAECILCMKLLYEPVTVPCGHSFCKPCLSRAMDHSNKCPMCRTVLHVGRELPVTITLKNLLEKSFPEEYEQRRAEEREAAAAVSANAPLPLFVMSLLLPGERMSLNIFEPRYRLMVRRCMDGQRLFGMATVNRQHQLFEVACEVEIMECQPQPDGRYYIEILGRRRVRLLDTWEMDGYRVARTEEVTDDVPEGQEEQQQLQREAAEVEQLADRWVERLRTLAQTRRGVAELLHRAGDKPRSNPEALSFWVANLICPILDEAGLKLQFMRTCKTVERLATARQVLQQLSTAQHPQGCSIM